MKWRENQLPTLLAAREYLAKKGKQKSAYIVAPVAYGKSWVIGGAVADDHSKILVLQPNIDLLDQNYKRFTEDFGGTASVYSASADSREVGQVTYATLGTIKDLGKDFRALGIRKVIVDECHHGYSPEPNKTFRKFLKNLNPTHLLGFTATPFRLNQYGNISDSYSRLDLLHTTSPRVFSECISIASIQSMLDGGYWSPLRYVEFDFNSRKLRLNSSKAEFTKDSVRAAIADLNIVSEIGSTLSKMLDKGYKSILVFLDSVASCERLKRQFPNSAIVSSKTKKSKKGKNGYKVGTRGWIVENFKNGNIPIVFNVGTMTTGFDFPELQAIVMGRPTNSLALYYQMVGRVVRIHPDKKEGLVIDYVGNVQRFGKLEDLNFEEIEGYGLGFFSKDRLLTNTRLDVAGKTKATLRGENSPSQMRMPFGKHKGVLMTEVPLPYMEWALENMNLKSSLRKAMKTLISGGILESKKEDMPQKIEGRDRLMLIDMNNIMFILHGGGNLTPKGLEEYITQLKIRTNCDKHILVVDSKSNSYWRKKPYPAYKANRDTRTTDWGMLEARKNCLEKVPHLRLDGLEADDIFGVYARTGKPVTVVSEDSDFTQLFLMKNFEQFLPRKRAFKTATKFEAIEKLFTIILKGDKNKDNIQKCHTQKRIMTKKLTPVLQELYTDMVRVIRQNGIKNVQEVPLRRIGRKHLECFGLTDLYNTNYNVMTLLSPKFEKYTKWTEESVLAEIEKNIQG